MESKKKESKKNFLGLDIDKRSTSFIVFGAVISLWLLFWFLTVVVIKDEAWAQRGQFGDMFGAINALFSGLAFAGVIITILLQREELIAQKEELRLNTEALNAQKLEMNAQWKELERQNSNLKRQRFETTFFNMWNIHFSNRDLITTGGFNGVLAFAQFINTAMNHAYKEDEKQGERKLSSMVKGAIIASNSSGFFPMAETYLNSLKLIHEYVIDARLGEKAKKRYLRIMKAYLSTSEIEFIVYYLNHLKDKGQEKSLLSVYNDLQLGDGFAYNFEQRWNLKLIFDEGIL
jgi:hypothetical protein